DQYKLAREELVGFTAELLEILSHSNPWVSVLNPSKCLYRINRDIRFSNDKTPYKTAAGIFIAPGGRSAGNAGYYLHIEPGDSFIGGGIYAPQAAVLRAIRQEIYFNSDSFIQILNAPAFKENFGQMMDERLKRPPKGFPADFKHIELLKYKHFVVSHPLGQETFSDKKAAGKLLPFFKAQGDFIAFLNKAIANSEEILP
ncbi:MAG: DUF2461 domain-containing protein, partial [Bacteroidales bacterium]|nr:DUF2461 domain-containing protein [Bacteroidales bacterium]